MFKTTLIIKDATNKINDAYLIFFNKMNCQTS